MNRCLPWASKEVAYLQSQYTNKRSQMVSILRQSHTVPFQVHFASHAAEDVHVLPFEVSTFGICQYTNYLNLFFFFKASSTIFGLL